ncbi:DUF3040 domain-containing protein [Actinomyces sp. zg-332]|uniref:DUF3040 domain-containing protein n=1 Tax=Actinomyces sp. zg-332 TaxID=2708340 RepID=UPI001422760B|nr:DUF3040 domain-containing protein [Actinomyces sp. zg-332]QPK94417.1 DUF3040 domain-containing protein [Actinomyces sp. zg-332]
MALSEYEENILAELENDLKGVGESFDDHFNDSDSTVNKNGGLFTSFNPRKAVLGFFGLLLGLILILFAVYSYSAFGVWVTVLVAILGFTSMVFSISKILQSFSL